MKFLSLVFATFYILFFSGCMTVHETPMPTVDARLCSNVKLALEDFQFYVVRATQHHYGYANTSYHNPRIGGWASGTGSYYGATYQRVPDDDFTRAVRDLFEFVGANTRGGTPTLIIEGRIGDGHYMWNSSAMWYRDVPVFIFALCSCAMTISCERENSVRMIVYDKNGNRLKEYYNEASYHAFSIGLPFTLFANPKAYETYGDKMAAMFALIKCVNDFVQDYNTGYYKQ